MKKIGTISIFLLMILSALQILWIPAISAQEYKEAALYFYGDGVGNETLETDVPTSSVGLSLNVGPTGGVFIMWLAGRFETDPLQKDIRIEGTIMFDVWVEQLAIPPGIVQIDCQLLMDNEDIGIDIQSERIVINEVHEITFEGYVDIAVDSGHTFGVQVGVLYSGVNMDFHWASADYPSNMVVPADWCSIEALDPVVDDYDKTTTITGSVLHALGPDEIVDFELEIDGPTSADSLSGPETSVNGGTVTATWVWDWGADDAENGDYDVIMTVIDNSNNLWSAATSFVISITQPPPPPPPTLYNWTTIGRITTHSNREYFPSLMQDSDGSFLLAYVVYQAYWPTDIYIKKSEDGINWGAPSQITTNYSWENHPSIMQDSDGIYWMAFTSDWAGDNHIWITNSNDGNDWEEPIQAITFRYDNIKPCLIQDSDGIYWIAWRHYNRTTRDWDICIISSQDGLNWDDSPTYITYDEHDDDYPSLIQDSSGTYRVAWSSDRFGNYDIFLSTSNDPKSNWGSPAQLTTGTGYDGDPSLIENVDGGYNISWYSYLYGDGEIWYIGSDDWNTWTSKEQVTENEYPNDYKYYPSLIQDSYETLWVAWTSYYQGNEDVWLSNKTTNEPPTVSITDPVGEQSGDISMTYSLKDSGYDKCEIIPLYSLDGSTFQEAALGPGGDGVSEISSTPGGTTHTFVWASAQNLSGVDISTVYFRIVPKDCQIGQTDTTSAFQVDNNALPKVEIDDISGVQTGSITFNYTLTDMESDRLSITPEYSIDGTEYKDATMDDDSPKIANIKSSAEGESYIFIWDSYEDLADQDESEVYFRITPEDDEDGIADTTSSFSVDNKAPTITSGPSVVSKTHITATISWETDEPSDGVLSYGTDTSYGNTVIGNSDTTTHLITLDLLTPETEYHYFVSSTDNLGNGPTETGDLTFTTEQIPNDPPEVTITSLKDNGTVDGKITILGEATDPDGDETIEFVELRVDDNEWVRAEGKSVWSFVLDTEDYDDGRHTLYVRAFDGREYSEELSLTIKVKNEEDALSIWLIFVIIALIAAIVLIAVALKTRSPRPKPLPSQDFYVTAQPAPAFIPDDEPVPAYEMIGPAVPAEPVEVAEYTPWNQL
ncbi:MAG: hypothetical protein JSV09_09710 [Thermoplasmata archaeon]|nr:MAG: hypothetical protein JSV09_09710 [Thermoplasmata archaeon]